MPCPFGDGRNSLSVLELTGNLIFLFFFVFDYLFSATATTAAATTTTTREYSGRCRRSG